MKNILKSNLIVILFLLDLLLFSCKTVQKQNPDLALINDIENGLLPSVIIEGSEQASFNILERMNHYKIPGVSIAYINHGELIWAKGYGFTTNDSLTAIDENTLFQAASISKPVAAMAALSLVEEGKLGLDTNVNDYLIGWQVPENEFTKTEKVTLRRLLTHSAGLTVHGFAGYASDDSVPTLIQVLNGEPPANSAAILPDIIPGTENRYSGGGYTVMQKMLIDITGKPFPEIMHDRVLSKIGMTNSMYEQPLPEMYQTQAAPGHRPAGKMIKGRWHTYPELAAAGLWTTPTDLMKYAIEVQNSFAGESNKVLSQKMTIEMLTDQIGSQGLGPGLNGKGDSLTFGHGGSNEGYRCQFMAYAKSGQGVAIMTNSDNGGTLIAEILRSFSKAYGWPGYKPAKKIIYQLTPDTLADFTGKYKYDKDPLNAEIVIEGDHLKFIQLWDSQSYTIYPESEQAFFNIEDGVSFEFTRNQDREITELIIMKTFRFVKIE